MPAYIAIIILCLLALGLFCLALHKRDPAPMLRGCPCEGCKILRKQSAPKARTLRDRLAWRGCQDA